MSFPPIWLSLLTMYIRPTAIPDISSNISSAATSVNPFERSCDFFPIGCFSLPRTNSLITVLKAHVACTDRGRQLHALDLFAVLAQALRPDGNVHFADLVGGDAGNRQRIALSSVIQAGGVIEQVVRDRQTDDVVCHRYRRQSVDLPHQAGRLRAR